MRSSDPRIRQTLNQISQNLETANETAQEGIYAFSYNYIEPCLASVRGCLGYCATSSCLGGHRDDHQLRRRKQQGGRSRGRAESNFDFYDDWDYEEDARGDSGLLGWGHDELERLLAGSGAANRGSNDQPRKHRRMSYGARRSRSILPNDERQDPTIIPSSSILGFLERFPWRIGARGTRYRPSGADLQENPGGLKRAAALEDEPLLEESDESDDSSARIGSRKDPAAGAHGGRQRSSTQSSQETGNSLSSRGDLFPSDDEEDAVPLDDEFAVALGPRIQRLAEDDRGGATRSSGSRASTKGPACSPNSRSEDKGKGKRRRRRSSPRKATPISKSPHSPSSDGEVVEVLTIEDLKKEEERAQREEEEGVERRRQDAESLARKRGLSAPERHRHVETEDLSPNLPVEGEYNPRAAPTSPQDDPSSYPLPPSPPPARHDSQESEPESPA